MPLPFSKERLEEIQLNRTKEERRLAGGTHVNPSAPPVGVRLLPTVQYALTGVPAAQLSVYEDTIDPPSDPDNINATTSIPIRWNRVVPCSIKALIDITAPINGQVECAVHVRIVTANAFFSHRLRMPFSLAVVTDGLHRTVVAFLPQISGPVIGQGEEAVIRQVWSVSSSSYGLIPYFPIVSRRSHVPEAKKKAFDLVVAGELQQQQQLEQQQQQQQQQQRPQQFGQLLEDEADESDGNGDDGIPSISSVSVSTGGVHFLDPTWRFDHMWARTNREMNPERPPERTMAAFSYCQDLLKRGKPSKEEDGRDQEGRAAAAAPSAATRTKDQTTDRGAFVEYDLSSRLRNTIDEAAELEWLFGGGREGDIGGSKCGDDVNDNNDGIDFPPAKRRQIASSSTNLLVGAATTCFDVLDPNHQLVLLDPQRQPHFVDDNNDDGAIMDDVGIQDHIDVNVGKEDEDEDDNDDDNDDDDKVPEWLQIINNISTSDTSSVGGGGGDHAENDQVDAAHRDDEDNDNDIDGVRAKLGSSTATQASATSSSDQPPLWLAQSSTSNSSDQPPSWLAEIMQEDLKTR